MDRRPPTFLGETPGVNRLTTKDISDEEPNALPQAASGMSGVKNVSTRESLGGGAQVSGGGADTIEESVNESEKYPKPKETYG